MLHEYVQPIIHFLHHNPHWGCAIAFFISFTESLAIVGTIMPGSVTMTAIGALAGSGVLPSGATFAWAIIGAYVGDCLSYWFGLVYNRRILKMWPFRKYPYLLEKGEKFFKKHGGKSVIIGRFTGPVRSLVPMIAGLLKMNPWRFFPVALVSATLWAVIYMLPGVILGALSLELPASVATQFILICLGIIAVLWGLTWLTKYFIDQMWNQVDRAICNFWQYLNVHKNSHWITQMLRNPQHDEDHQQLVLATFFIISTLIFFWILFEVINQGALTHLNLPIYNLLQSIRTKTIDGIMIPLTVLGDETVLLSMAGIMLLWLFWKRQWWAAIHWVTITFLSVAAVKGFKSIIDSPRPPFFGMYDSSSSFPSGHTLLTWTLLTFMITLITNHLSAKKRSRGYFVVFAVLILVAFSRLYLGAHWFTDILASFFLGSAILLGVILSYRRHTTKPLPVLTTSLIFVIVLLISWGGHTWRHFKPVRQAVTPVVQVQQISRDQWWQQTPGQIPFYLTNRLGHIAHPLNVQWMGSLTTIQENLLKQGWQTRPPKLTLETTINQIFPPKNQTHIPFLPMLYHGRSPVLLLIKNLGPNRPILMLRLWQSDITFSDTIRPLWIGTVNYYQPPEKLLSLETKQPSDFVNATHELVPFLKSAKWKVIEITQDQQPDEMHSMNWEGKLLLIRTE